MRGDRSTRGRRACDGSTPPRRMLRHGRRRRGAVALATVLVALVVLGALAAGLALQAQLGQAATRRTVAAARAAAAAEGALANALLAWPAGDPTSLPIGGVRSSAAAPAPDVATVATIARHAPLGFALGAVATVRPPGAARATARRAVRLLVALAPSVPLPAAALTLGGDAALHGAAVASGRDTIPPGWACEAADTLAVAGVAHAPAAVVSVAAGAAVGEPAVRADTAAADAARYVHPEPALPALVAANPLRPPPTVAPTIAPHDDGAACRGGPATPWSWGDPRRPSPCAAQLPLVRVAGDLRRPRGAGQGVLVVDGDLELAGGFTFVGVVVVRGRIVARGPDDLIVGALLAGGAAGAPHDLAGVRVRWASCVVRQALAAAGVVRPLRDRAWSAPW